MQNFDTATVASGMDVHANDLGPLAWVLDELRKSLDTATKALRRYVRDADLARGSDLASVDTGQLRISRQQLHQAVGALEMVGFTGPAIVLRSMENAVQKFVSKPELCTEAAAAKIERASFALTGFLETVLAGKAQTPVTLFEQYAQVQEIAGAPRVHPADLWAYAWRWIDVADTGIAPVAIHADTRSEFDKAGLMVIKALDAQSARNLAQLSASVAAPLGLTVERQFTIFWRIAAGFFEAIASASLVGDVYVKRTASRILTQMAAHVKGDMTVSDRLAQDLLFFCAQAQPKGMAPLLGEVRMVYGLAAHPPVNYAKSPYGQFDPALLVQARKRITAAKESWSGLSAGDMGKLKAVQDQFSLIVDSITKLLPSGQALSKALMSVAEASTKSGHAPEPALGMEVATSILYLEAGFEDFDPNDPALTERVNHLAQRVENARNGATNQALEPWMEELYRRVSDKQTMGSVVGELKTSLAELEKSMDQFFRDPQDKTVLSNVPSRLAQMRGVLSVLGLDHASHAVLRMRDSVEQILVTEVDDVRARAAGTFDKIGNNLGALGFLIDMLSYQPVLAKKLFVFDEERGELKPLMGRVNTPIPLTEGTVTATPSAPTSTVVLAPAPAASMAALTAATAAVVSVATTGAAAESNTMTAASTSAQDASDDDAELLDIFLEEAREVIDNGQSAVTALVSDPSNLADMTTLRRAFHTLKGSSRMVGLTTFGEAGWSYEQMLNAWLADQKPADEALCHTASEGLAGMSRWVDDIAAGRAQAWTSAPFRASADALRVNGQFLPLHLDSNFAVQVPHDAPVQHDIPAQTEAASSSGYGDLRFDAAPAAHASALGAEVLAVPLAAVAATAIAATMPAPAVPAVSQAADLDFAFDMQLPELAADAPVSSQAPLSALPEELRALDLSLSKEPALPVSAAMPVVQEEPDFDLDFAFDLGDASTLTADDSLSVVELGAPATATEPVAMLEQTPVVELMPDVDAELDAADEFADVFGDVPAPASSEQEVLEVDGITFDLGDDAAAVNDELVSADEFAAFERAMLEQDALVAAADAKSAIEAPGMDMVGNLSSQTQGANETLLDASDKPMDFGAYATQAMEYRHEPEPAPVSDLGIDLGNLGSAGSTGLGLAGVGALALGATAVAGRAPSVQALPSRVHSGPASLASDEQYKAIGPLRINLPLYNVYLNEADEWSRRLLMCLTEWSLELNQPLPNDAIVFAHSLAGSSSTVGFTALSGLARAMENALQHVQNSSGDGAYSAHSYAADFVSGAEEIRRLLHQFAAGLLREPLASVEEALARCLRAPEPATEYHSITAASADSGFVNLDDGMPLASLHTARAVSYDAPHSEPAQLSAAPVHSGFASLSDTSSVTVIAAATAATVAATVTVPDEKSSASEIDDATDMDFEFPQDAAPVAPLAEIEAVETQALEPVAIEVQDDQPAVTELPQAEHTEAEHTEAEHTEAAAASAAVHEAPAVTLSSEPKPHFPVLGVAAAGLASTAVLSVVSRNLTEQETEDEIDLVDALDPDLFPIFEEEALELFPQMGGALRQWTSRPSNTGARSEVLRGLHTLKGSARLAGALRLGELAHRMESAIEQTPEDEVTTAQLEPLTGLLDGMQANFDRLRHPQEAVAEPARAPVTSPVNAPSSAGSSPSVAPMLATPALTAMAPLRAASANTGAIAAPVLRGSSNQTVRVRSQLLDRLVNQAGEVMITRSRLEAELGQLRGSLGDLTANLDKLRLQLRDIEVQSESQMQSRMALAKENNADFDPLEFDRFTRVQELTRMMAESVNDVATVQRSIQRTVEATEDDLVAQARQTRELQRDLLRTRMVEFEGISERLYRVVRQAGKDAGKQVKLDITGGSIEMDRGVLDRMTPAFEHLLRNCVAHGIETAEARVAAGKDASGQILISLHQEGNDISVEFRDDGAGLDLKRIRERASAQGLLSHGQQVDDSEAANLIFTPGFTTATQVTELSGRGIGMDVVRSEVVALGGKIETSTSSGQGTNFKLVLPLTTAVTQVVMLRIGNLSIGVPANLVETVLRATPKDLQAGYNTGTFDVAGEALPFFWSGALLQHSRASDSVQGKTIPVLVFRSAAQRIVAHVDEVLGNQEVVVKNLGPQMSRLPGLAGMSVLASGAVALIYNPVALAAVYGEQARAMSFDKAEPHAMAHAVTDVEHRDLSGDASPVVPFVPANPNSVSAPQIPLILVVDDSITVRRVTQRLLQREGYRVALAADGLQALERLAEELPSVVLSDIEMPRMDGFDLVRNIKADPRLASLPIITITSRIAEKHREHAKALGVDHYLGKPYSEEELLSLIRRYTAIEMPV
jgi:chemosensory pili system protein ChpA (sensor histidine kinase/response regulator)